MKVHSDLLNIPLHLLCDYYCMIMQVIAIGYDRMMLYTRLASPVAVCIAILGRYTRLAWLATNPNPSYG